MAGPHTNSTREVQYDPTFTDCVIAATGPRADPRLREVYSSLVRHLHDFCREVHLNTDEFMMGVNLLNWAGQMSNDRRNEGQLVADVLGLESLVDEITYKQAAATSGSVTSSAILGPFWRSDTPIREFGSTITFDTPADGQVAYMTGVITDASTNKPIHNALVDIWQASTNGLYEQQDTKQCEWNLRGKFYTNNDGRYALYCLRPTPYPVPNDGPAGKVLDLLDRHHYRPGHIHLIVTAKGYLPITTQIFDRKSPYLDNDSVFAVKDGLTVDFVPREHDAQAACQLEYDISMSPST